MIHMLCFIQVTREIERDIALARQKLLLEGSASDPAAAVGTATSNVQLRSLDCLNR
jgi:hypothetical protein